MFRTSERCVTMVYIHAAYPRSLRKSHNSREKLARALRDEFTLSSYLLALQGLLRQEELRVVLREEAGLMHHGLVEQGRSTITAVCQPVGETDQSRRQTQCRRDSKAAEQSRGARTHLAAAAGA